MNEQEKHKPPQPPPEVIEVSGTEPGVLDPTQRNRILRSPESKLLFASFDPYIAIPQEIVDLANLSLQDDRCRPKRIVVEMDPGRGTFWRWIPSARKQENVDNEGEFPRIVLICGQHCWISQEQWDIYKLDPIYDCFVRFSPLLTEISLRDPTTRNWKRTVLTSNGSEVFTDDGNDSDRMVVDDDNAPPQTPTRKRQRSRRKTSPRTAHDFNFNDHPTASTSRAHNLEEGTSSKRNAHISFQGLRPSEEEENAYFEEDSFNRDTKFYTPVQKKRARTLPPRSLNPELTAKKNARKAAKQTKLEQEKAARRLERDRNFLREVLSEVPQAQATSNGAYHFSDIPDIPEEEMEDAFSGPPPTSQGNVKEETEEESEVQRLAESRKKMAELNADRDRQRQREKTVRAETEAPSARRAKTETRHREEQERLKHEEAARKEDELRRQEEKKARQQEQARRRREEVLRQRQDELHQRHEQWFSGPWNLSRALERYRICGAFFDKTQFSPDDQPLALIDIPWPTLCHPANNTASEVDWDTVKDFFTAAKGCTRPNEYKILVRQSMHRFHPDRWTSRRLYISILDEAQRNEIETTVTTVSKALGALYSDVARE